MRGTLMFVSTEFVTVLRSIAARLTPAVVAMGTVTGAGTRESRRTPFTGEEHGFSLPGNDHDLPGETDRNRHRVRGRGKGRKSPSGDDRAARGPRTGGQRDQR